MLQSKYSNGPKVVIPMSISLEKQDEASLLALLPGPQPASLLNPRQLTAHQVPPPLRRSGPHRRDCSSPLQSRAWPHSYSCFPTTDKLSIPLKAPISSGRESPGGTNDANMTNGQIKKSRALWGAGTDFLHMGQHSSRAERPPDGMFCRC